MCPSLVDARPSGTGIDSGGRVGGVMLFPSEFADASLPGGGVLGSSPRSTRRHSDSGAKRTGSRSSGGSIGTRFSLSETVTMACQMGCVSRTERNGTIMTMTNEKQQHDDGPSGQDLVEQLKASGQLDALFEQIDAGQVELTGDGGFVPALVKAALERG